MGGGGGGGAEPLILPHAYTIIVILSVCMSVPNKNCY